MGVVRAFPLKVVENLNATNMQEFSLPLAA